MFIGVVIYYIMGGKVANGGICLGVQLILVGLFIQEQMGRWELKQPWAGERRVSGVDLRFSEIVNV